MDPSNEGKNNCSLRPAKENQAMNSIVFGNGFNNKTRNIFVFTLQLVGKFSKIEFHQSTKIRNIFVKLFLETIKTFPAANCKSQLLKSIQRHPISQGLLQLELQRCIVRNFFYFPLYTGI